MFFCKKKKKTHLFLIDVKGKQAFCHHNGVVMASTSRDGGGDTNQPVPDRCNQQSICQKVGLHVPTKLKPMRLTTQH